MTTTSTRRAILAGAIATIPAAIAVPALAKTGAIDPLDAAIEELKLNPTVENLRKAFAETSPKIRELFLQLAREEALGDDIQKDAKLVKLFEKFEAACAEYEAYDQKHGLLYKRFEALC